jgi:hypothetical protein
MALNIGDPVHLEVDTSDAHAAGGVVFRLYKAGSKTAISLASNQWVTITDILLIMTAGGAYVIAFDAALTTSTDGTQGTLIAKGNAGTKGGMAHHFETPIEGLKGVLPYICADAGVLTCVLTGYIQES